ncbi:MAG: hypothetical protein U0T75_05875 [Chitinophagales bacterium]
MLKKYAVHIVVIVVLVVLGVRSCYKQHRASDLLLANFKVTDCQVTKTVRAVRPSRLIVYYEFEVDSMKYTGTKIYPLLKVDPKILSGLQFPVAYEVSDPSNNEIIVTASDFAKFNLKPPGKYEMVR